MSTAVHRVSTVIPAYNCARYVAAAIDSVRGQTRPPDELIVVDDGSTDNTLDVLARCGDGIVVCPRPHLGLSAALNSGLDLATGDILTFLDADDLWTPEKTARQLARLDADPALEAVFGTARQFVSPDLPQAAAARLRCPPGLQPGVIRAAMMIRRGAFDRVGRFDEERRVSEYLAWYARAVEADLRVGMVEDTVLLRRLHRDNLSIREGSAQRAAYVEILKQALDRRRARG